ncbi:hypothetical protein [Methylobacterium sp. WCS2018Hpa-22]|uniref:hypothetical protein n=1 Tax=Methylobacterium sp. WCS2018Hpa-22 TaxID=3073633 RepID=UPI00288C3970|nr:hypothetical protein [Methylobacterium sp. WCS2018Hpa-22]
MKLSQRRGIALLLIMTGVSMAGTTLAGAGSMSPSEVVACDTLVNLRVLMGQARADLGDHPVCRRIARDRVGAPEHRAMIGGAPFECLAVRDEPSCLWIKP